MEPVSLSAWGECYSLYRQSMRPRASGAQSSQASSTTPTILTTPPPSGGFWSASAGHESFSRAIDRDVREHPADYSKVRQLLQAMLARLAAGRSAGNALPSNPQAARRQVLAALRSPPKSA